MKSSDLESVKSVADAFLYTELLVDKRERLLVHHPFFSCSVVIHNGAPVNIFDDAIRKDVCDKLKEKIHAARSAGDIAKMIQPKYQLEFFSYIHKYLGKEDYAVLLRDAWTDAEFPNRDPSVTLAGKIGFFRKADKSLIMDPQEQMVYEALPEKVTVYRGINSKGSVKGISWTLSKKKAYWFASRWPENKGMVYQAMVSKEHIYAYFNGRNEQEVILDSRKLLNIEQIKV